MVARGMPNWWMEGDLMVEDPDEKRPFTPGRKCFRTGNALCVRQNPELSFFRFFLLTWTFKLTSFIAPLRVPSVQSHAAASQYNQKQGQDMQLRFCVNQAEAFRQGIDCPKSIVQLEVDPATLDETTRRLIADRMKGIDVYQLEYRGGETAIKLDYEPVSLSLSVPVRIEAKAPTFEAMMEAVKGKRYA